MIAVTPAPTKTPSTGFAIVANNCANWGRSSQRRDRAFHRGHTDKQNAESGKDIRDITGPALFGEHHNDNTGQDNQKGEVFRLKHLHEQIAAYLAAAVQPQNLRGDRGTDIRAQNNTDRLPQRHYASVYKADHHDRRR